jgi:hypothetical protein
MMMKFITEEHPVACAVVLVMMAVLVTACGNDGATVPTDPFVTGTMVPVSATTTTAGVVSFGQSVAIGTDDAAEPLAVEGAELATSETDEPDSKV